MRIGSLLSGYGGLDLAVASVLGASVAWHVEFDKHPSAILAHHFPDVPNYGDVSTVDWSAVEPVDILTGGFPCQDLSTAGKRAGLRPGTRSGLWEHMAYAINQLRPELVVIENVRGLLSAAAHSDVEPCPLCVGDDPSDALRALGAVLGDLADIGYDAQWCGLRAADAGAPHGRFRVFIVAYPSDPGGRQFTRTAAAGHGLPVTTERSDEPVELSLLPTPKATNNENQQSLGYRPNLGMALMPDQYDWSDAPQLLPTPRATDGTKGGPNQRGSSGDLMLPSAAVQLLSTPTAGLGEGGGQRSHRWRSDSQRTHNPAELARDIAEGTLTDFGPYAAAVARWGATLGRPAPAPTEPGTNGKPRLSPAFVEWMMGLSAGWVTDVDISRNAQLKALGNGVVPQQAALALRLLMGRAA